MIPDEIKKVRKTNTPKPDNGNKNISIPYETYVIIKEEAVRRKRDGEYPRTVSGIIHEIVKEWKENRDEEN